MARPTLVRPRPGRPAQLQVMRPEAEGVGAVGKVPGQRLGGEGEDAAHVALVATALPWRDDIGDDRLGDHHQTAAADPDLKNTVESIRKR